jgi:hypothetical protein
LDGDTARAILLAVDDMDGAVTRAPGQRLDLAMAMCAQDVAMLPTILDSCFSQDADASPEAEAMRRYLLAKLPVLVDTLAGNPVLLPDLVNRTAANRGDFWLRLLSLKWPEGFNRLPIVLQIIGILKERENVAKWIMLVVEKREVISDADAALGLYDLAMRDCAEQQQQQGKQQQQPQLLQVIEYLVTIVPADRILARSLTCPSVKRAVEAVMLCLTLAKVFRPPVIVAAYGAALDQPTIPPVLYRALLQAITIHGPAVTAFAVTALTRLAQTDSPWDGKDDRWSIFLKAVRLLLPHSLTLLAGNAIPTQQLQTVLGHDGELRRPVRDYLFQQPPSVRARYAAIMKMIE